MMATVTPFPVKSLAATELLNAAITNARRANRIRRVSRVPCKQDCHEATVPKRARVPARRERSKQRTNDTRPAAPRDRRPPIREHDGNFWAKPHEPLVIVLLSAVPLLR